jgi:hypothetical protein
VGGGDVGFLLTINVSFPSKHWLGVCIFYGSFNDSGRSCSIQDGMINNLKRM